MTDAETFRAWRACLGITQAQAAEALGLCFDTIRNIERGRRTGADPRPVVLTRTQRLAMAAVERRLAPWSPAEPGKQ